MNDDKGPQRAIAAAREASVPLVLAGPIQPGQEEFFAREVEPHLDDDQVKYVGEVGGDDKTALFAHASAFLMPIRWAEPFGLVMTEAMACGTPVIAFPEGSACEVIADGQTGFLVNDVSEMAAAVARLREIDPARCREWVSERFDLEPVAEAHERAYRRVLADRPPQPPGCSPRYPSRYHRRVGGVTLSTFPTPPERLGWAESADGCRSLAPRMSTPSSTDAIARRQPARRAFPTTARRPETP
jgi:hypothetical protein